MNEKICPSCRQANAPDMSFCLNCGASLLAAPGGFPTQPSYPGAGFGSGLPAAPPALPDLPTRPARQSRTGLYVLLGILGVVLVVGVGGVIGLFALLRATQKPPTPENTNYNRSVVTVSPTPVANRSTNSNAASNSNSKIYTGNLRASNVSVGNSASSNAGSSPVYVSLTDNLTMSDIAQPQVGEFRLSSKEAAPNWKTVALEAENHYYSGSQLKPTLTVARFGTGEDARKALRDSIEMYKDRGDETSEVSLCVNRDDQKPIGLTGLVREKKTNTYRRYWTDGKYLFAVGVVGDKAATDRFMNSSSY